MKKIIKQLFRTLFFLKKICIKLIFNTVTKLTVSSYGKKLSVLGISKFNSNTFLGNNVNFNGFKVNGHGKVQIGDNFHSGVNCRIISDVHNYDYGESIPYDKTYISKDVIFEENVWLGNDVLILGGVTIGEGAIIQAGSVVVSDIPKYGIAGGNPAKVFKYRDIEHYNKLKSLERYH